MRNDVDHDQHYFHFIPGVGFNLLGDEVKNQEFKDECWSNLKVKSN